MKEAFEQIATKAAADRSKAEQACLAERQAKELLHKHNCRISELENRVEHLQSTKESLDSAVANHRERSIEMQRDIDAKALMLADVQLKMDDLKATIKEKDGQIEGLYRSVCSEKTESNEMHRNLKECRKAKSRLELRVEQLQTRLDEIHDEMRATRDSTVNKDLLDAEKTKNAELERTNEELRRQQKAHESALRDYTKRMNREHVMTRENSLSQAKLIKSLERKLAKARTDWNQKESQLIDRHRLDMKESKITMEQESISLKTALDDERSKRQEAERRIASLEAAQNDQKTKMQSAIEGLTKQLSTLS